MWFVGVVIPDGSYSQSALYKTTVLNQHTGFHHQEQEGGKLPTPLILNKKTYVHFGHKLIQGKYKVSRK